jgi:hypothetical protein
MSCDDLIDQVVNFSRIPLGKRRREIRRELQAHVEDFIAAAREAGRDEEEIERMVAASFGDPAQIAVGFAWVYRRERAMVRVGVLLLSSLAVASLMLSAILTLQAGIALGFRHPALTVLASSHTAIEALDILFTVITFGSLAALEELFEENRFIKALASVGLAFAVLTAVCAALDFRTRFLVFGVVNGAFFRIIHVFVKSELARTGMVAAALALLGLVAYQVMPLRFPYIVSACASWLAMGVAYRKMPDAVERMNAALFHRLQRI